MSITELHRRVAAVCPIDGVGGDKSIAYRPEATTQQRADAKAIADAYDLNAPPPWAPIKAALLDDLRSTREQIIDRLSGISGRRQRAGDLTTSQACDAAVLRLLDLTTRPDVLAATDAAQLRTAIKAGYAEAKALLPAAVQNAFRGLDA